MQGSEIRLGARLFRHRGVVVDELHRRQAHRIVLLCNVIEGMADTDEDAYLQAAALITPHCGHNTNEARTPLQEHEMP